MQVFKVYFKIIKKNLAQMSIYFIVFLTLSVLLANAGESRVSGGFSETRSNIALFNYDAGSPLSEGLAQYLSENANIINISDDTLSVQDALFFRQVVYIVKIPKGFSEAFLKGSDAAMLEKTTVPDSTSGIYMDLLIDRYLNTAALYSQNVPGIGEEQLVSNVNSDLELKADVSVISYGPTSGVSGQSYYYTYLVYSIMAILILGVTSNMIVFNEPDIKRRNLSSPMSTLGMSMQLLLANLTFAAAVWAAMVLLSFFIYGQSLLNPNTLLLMLNSLVLTLVCMSISFLVGSLIKSRNAQSAVANVLSLGLCFIGGVFVPQELLGETILKIASFTPTYWYVKSVRDISSLVDFSSANLAPIFYSTLIQLGFAAVILTVSLVIAKQKRLSEG